MLLGYSTIIGIPVLLLLSSFLAPFNLPGYLERILQFLIGVGCVIYGIVGYREVYKRGRSQG
jgi:hypothetical protein